MAKSKLQQQLEALRQEVIEQQEEREEIAFQNERALKAQAPGVDTPDTEMRPHNLDLFKDVMDGVYGINLKGRLCYNLNFLAQRTLRDALRQYMGKDAQDDALSDILSDDDLAGLFGFEVPVTYPLDQAIHWVMVTYIAAHDVAMYTEADRYGRKTRPYAWIEAMARTPIGMVAHDALYGIRSAVDQQAVQMAKLGITNAEAMTLFESRQKAHAKEQTAAKVVILKQYQNVSDHSYRYEYGTDEVFHALEEMISVLGLDIPAMIEDIADRYVTSAKERLGEGKYVGEVDERIVDFVPAITGGVGTSAARRTDRVAAETGAYIEHMTKINLNSTPTNPGVNEAGVEKALRHRLSREEADKLYQQQ